MNEPVTFGPYEAERDTYDTPLYAAWRDLPFVGVHDFQASSLRARDLKLDHLVDACGAAGVALGAFDIRILTWLAGFEAAAVQVFIGAISRAYAAGPPRRRRRPARPDRRAGASARAGVG